MKNTSKNPSRVAAWFRKHMEGEMLLQWSVYIILFITLLLFIISHNEDLPAWRFYGAIISLAMVLVLNILWIRWGNECPPDDRQHPSIDWAFLSITGVLILAAVLLGEMYNAIFLFFMVCSQAAVVLSVWPGGLLYSLVSLVIWMVAFGSLGVDAPSLISLGGSLGVGVLFVLFVATLLDRYSRQTRRAEELLKELQAANLRLEAARQKEKELAIAEERVRLARDIHDGLGHHLTVLSIQLQAADKLVEKDQQAAADAIRQSRTEAQAALEEVRRSVGMMRQSPLDGQPLEDVLSGLVRDFGQRTGLEAGFEQTGSPVELSPFAKQTIFRTVQESLTNTQKHGKDARHAWVTLAYLPEAVHLLVRNDGQSSAPESDQGPGYGLVGLQERVEQLGGTIHSGPAEGGGFEVEVHIPLQEGSHDPGSAG